MTSLTKERLDKLTELYLNKGGEIGAVGVKVKTTPVSPFSGNSNGKTAPKETITREEVVELTGFTATKIMALVRFGKFPKPALSSKQKYVNKYWKRSEVIQFLESNTNTINESSELK